MPNAPLRQASWPAAAQQGLFEQEKLSGDWGGTRKTLKDAGVDLEVNDTAETLSNPVGGIKQAAIYQGLLATTITLDFEQLVNWPGATVYAEGYQISGRSLSRNAIGSALPSTRLVDLWFQQEFLDRKASLRVARSP